jgi:hypothetical protein
VLYEVGVWFTSLNQPQTQIYSNTVTNTVHGNHDKAKFNGIPYSQNGEVFIQVRASGIKSDGSVTEIANVQGNPFDHTGFSATLSPDSQSLVLTVWKEKVKVDKVYFVISAGKENPGGVFQPYWNGQSPVLDTKRQKTTYTTLVPFLGDGNYFFQVYVYNAADNTLLGMTFGDPREGTGM